MESQLRPRRDRQASSFLFAHDAVPPSRPPHTQPSFFGRRDQQCFSLPTFGKTQSNLDRHLAEQRKAKKTKEMPIKASMEKLVQTYRSTK